MATTVNTLFALLLLLAFSCVMEAAIIKGLRSRLVILSARNRHLQYDLRALRSEYNGLKLGPRHYAVEYGGGRTWNVVMRVDKLGGKPADSIFIRSYSAHDSALNREDAEDMARSLNYDEADHPGEPSSQQAFTE